MQTKLKLFNSLFDDIHRAHKGTVDVEGNEKKQKVQGEGGFMLQVIDKPFRNIVMQSVAPCFNLVSILRPKKIEFHIYSKRLMLSSPSVPLCVM